MKYIKQYNEEVFWKKNVEPDNSMFITKINGKEFHELSQDEKKNIPDDVWKKISPYVKKDCYHCSFLTSALSLWCSNEDAIEYRGTNKPGVYNCHFWQPNEKMIQKSREKIKKGDL